MLGRRLQPIAAALCAAMLLSFAQITVAQPLPPISVAPAAQPDPRVVANWTAALHDAPIAREQGTYPLQELDSFPGVVVVPGQAETPFAGMAVLQVGWTTDLISDSQPFYAVDLEGEHGSAQWLGSVSRARYERQLAGGPGMPACQPTAGYCSSKDSQGILAQELFQVRVEGWADPVIVSHWGNYLGHFEFWAANWHAADSDMSYQVLLSGAAPGTPPLTFDARTNAATAEAMARLATTFGPWTP